MKKKLLATILSIMTLVSFAGCGSTGSGEAENSSGGK